MGKVIYSINISLDGCCDHTKPIGADEETHQYYAKLIQEADLLAYGRKTYELMVPYWPDVAKNPEGHSPTVIEFAKAFNAAEKVMFSRSTTTNLQEEILKLKQDKTILLGGVDVPSQLIKSGLVDEYLILVHPVVIGEGRRLLEDIYVQLKLVQSTIFKSGCVALRYINKG